MDDENRKVIFEKGEFHDFEHTVTSFDGEKPIDEFITLPACWIKGDTIEYWAETYRWMGTQDDQGRFVYRHMSSKFVRSQKRDWATSSMTMPKTPRKLEFDNIEREEVPE